MSERKIRIILSVAIFFLMGLMGANIVVRVVNQRQNIAADARDASPFGKSEDFFTREQFEAQEGIYRGRVQDATSSPAR